MIEVREKRHTDREILQRHVELCFFSSCVLLEKSHQNAIEVRDVEFFNGNFNNFLLLKCYGKENKENYSASFIRWT